MTDRFDWGQVTLWELTYKSAAGAVSDECEEDLEFTDQLHCPVPGIMTSNVEKDRFALTLQLDIEQVGIALPGSNQRRDAVLMLYTREDWIVAVRLLFVIKIHASV